MKTPMRFILSIAALAVLRPACAQQGTQYSTDYSRLYDIEPKAIVLNIPSKNVHPSSPAECSRISSDAQKQADDLVAAHAKCLKEKEDAHEISRNVENKVTTCNFAACQNLHTAKNTADDYVRLANQYEDACNKAWSDAQDEKRKQKKAQEEAERVQRDADRRAEQEADDKKQAQADARAKRPQQDDDDARKQAQEDARKQANDQAKTDAMMRQWAAEESQREQKALIERTAKREQQLAQVDADAAGIRENMATEITDASNQTAAMDAKLMANVDPIGTSNNVSSDADIADPDPQPSPVPASSTTANPSAALLITEPLSPPPTDAVTPADAIIPPADPEINFAFRNTHDGVIPPSDLAEAKDETDTTDPPDSITSRIQDKYNDVIASAKTKYQAAKATISTMLHSPAVQMYVEIENATKGTIPLPNTKDTDEERADRVIGQAGIGLYKFSRYPPPQALYKYYKANINAINADLGLAYADFGLTGPAPSSGNDDDK